jgi:hypothetical protein
MKNNLKKIASLISGYGLEETSAKDDGYYECETHQEKKAYVLMIGNVAEDVMPVSSAEAEKIIEFLDLDADCENDWFYAYESLSCEEE